MRRPKKTPLAAQNGTGSGVAAARRFRPLRDLPTVGWLAATVLAALLHVVLPAPRWLLIHLLLLGAVSHSILVWSRHFADTLLHMTTSAAGQRSESVRLGLLNGGTVAVVVGVLGGGWPVTVIGAAGVATAVGWHGASLLVRLRSALPARFAMTVRYYVAAAGLLPVGALIGTLLARSAGDGDHERLLIAHVTLNVLGWIGLTVLGTLLTLWPTMLRTRIAPFAERAASRALPVLLSGLAVTVAATLLGVLPGAAVGLALYLVGLGVLSVPFVKVARAKPPSVFASWSVLAGIAWFAGLLVVLTVGLAGASGWAEAHDRLLAITPAFAAGFAAQVLLGALSYLIPVTLRGGPIAVRAANRAIDRGAALRLTLVNAGLMVSVPPVPSAVRVLGTGLVLGGFAVFLPLMVSAIRASRRARSTNPARPIDARSRGQAAGPPRGQAAGYAVTGLAAVVLTVAAGVAIDPAAVRGATTTAGPPSAGVAATGRTTAVEVTAADMRFTPSRIEVPAGDRLVITVRNTDPDTVHDLVVDSGADSGRLAPGATGLLDAGVVGRDLRGWCSVVGHRQLGMVFEVVVLGAPNEGGTDAPGAPGPISPGPADPNAADSAARALDFGRAPDPSFVAHPAQLRSATPTRIHRQTLTVQEVVREVAPGVTQRRWTYNGSVPGPVLRGAVGDTFEITLVNRAGMGHSLDFHAGSLAPDQPMRTIPPGESLVYTFTADHAGIWMYHCSTKPMSAHIANGMFGAVVIDPPRLAPVAREFLLLQSELYLGKQGGPVDADKVNAERPDAVVFNGYANQYDHRPLTARAGERIRIWVLDAGPNRSAAFHVIGGQFDTVYSEGAYLLRRGQSSQRGGSQVLPLAPAQGGFVELRLPEAGHYPVISHLVVDAERGAHGLIAVTR